MKPLRALRLLCLVTSVSILGCSTGSDLKQNTDDVIAINKIYESSPWVVKNSKLDLKAREGGAVEVSLEAIATRRGEARGPIWLPLAMVSELPDYFEGTDLTTTKPIELEAYRVPDGLWVITIVLPEPANPIVSSTPVPTPPPTPATTPEPAQTPVQTAPPLSDVTTDIKVRVTMVSKEFVSGFPILIPSGEGSGAVAATVTLPGNASFSTLDMTSGDRSDQSTLTALPVSMTGNERKAAIRLIPESSKAWNFANVTYTLNTSGTWRPWFFPSAVLILILAATLWWQFERVRDHRKSLSTLRRTKEKSLKGLRHNKHEFMAIIPSLAQSGDESDSKLRQILFGGIHLVPDHGDFGEADMRLWYREVAEPTSSLLKDYRWQNPELAVHLQVIERITIQLEELERLNQSLRYSYKNWRWVRQVLWGLCLLLLGSMIWLLSTVARAQPGPPPTANKPVVARLATLGELSVDIIPQIPTSDNYDKVNVNLSFFPLSEAAGQQALEEIGIGVSDYANLSIDPVQLPPNSPAKLVQETGKLVRLSVPVSVAPVLERWKILADWKPVEFSATTEYLNSLNLANKVNLTYTIKGAQVVRERAGGRFFHWFPFDTAEVQFPIDLRQPAILSQISLQPPTSEYVASPILEGLANQFVMSESGRSYQSSSKEQQGRAAIWANKPVVLKASFQRPWWQRYGLLVGQLFIGAIAGVLTGWLVFKGDKSGKSKIIAGFGIVGLPLAIWYAAMAKYDNLPTILLFQGITLFEVFFLANILLMFIMSLISYKRFGGTS
jgi:hypothetical protein